MIYAISLISKKTGELVYEVLVSLSESYYRVNQLGVILGVKLDAIKAMVIPRKSENEYYPRITEVT